MAKVLFRRQTYIVSRSVVVSTVGCDAMMGYGGGTIGTFDYSAETAVFPADATGKIMKYSELYAQKHGTVWDKEYLAECHQAICAQMEAGSLELWYCWPTEGDENQ